MKEPIAVASIVGIHNKSKHLPMNKSGGDGDVPVLLSRWGSVGGQSQTIA